jgi:nicotinate phosphoribosyltransferase
VQGPIIQCQLLETMLLNTVNFQTLVATKAARIALAAKGEPVLEFGLRRAQGPDGAVMASRAAYVGGCSATSNLLAGKLYGIPVAGTHAHSWVMCFGSELEAFEAYADSMPDNCVFLVDTYDTLEGVRNAVRAGQRLAASGHKLLGIRLDSGDLAWLSAEARKLLDAAGLQHAFIVGSNDLDEHLIQSLKNQGAEIHVWGVGTRLVTAFDEPALGGVYKITALRRAGAGWEDKIKLSERAAKTTTPGVLQVRRFRAKGLNVADAIYDPRRSIPDVWTIVDPNDPTRTKTIDGQPEQLDLLQPAMRDGKAVSASPSLREIQAFAQQELACLHPSIQRFANPHEYPVGLESGLARHRMEMILQHKNAVAASKGKAL